MYLFLDTAEFAESIFSGVFSSVPFRVMPPEQHQHSKGCTDASTKEVLLLKPPTSDSSMSERGSCDGDASLVYYP